MTKANVNIMLCIDTVKNYTFLINRSIKMLNEPGFTYLHAINC